MQADMRFTRRCVSARMVEGKVFVVIDVLRVTPPSSKRYPMDAPR